MALRDFTQDLFIKVSLGRRGQKVSVSGADIYYESYGVGEPLLLFHGGCSSLHTFRYQIPYFSKYFQVILPERPGNGHAEDIEGDYSYETMADWMIEFCKKLKIKKVRAVGYSDGAILLYFMALKQPSLIERMVSIGGNFHHEGCEEVFQNELREIDVDQMSVDRMYEKYSPDPPEHSREVFRKTRRLWLEEPLLTELDIQKIKTPTLVLAGDQDVVTPEHTVQLFKNLKSSELAILPASSHGVIKESPDFVNLILHRYLTKTIAQEKEPKKVRLWERILGFPLVLAVRFYQAVISPMIGPSCKFQPSCSEYLIEAVGKHGLFKGHWLGLKRLLRCHPWSLGGEDPVP